MLVRDVAVRARRLDLAGRRVLVAVSGGIDSAVLLAALRESAGPLGLSLVVGHVDHGLRGAESRADAAFVRARAESLGLTAAAARVEPARLRAGRSSRERPTLQEACRALRYAALRRLAAKVGAERVATAHTADDQAETVLLRLLRGTGPDGLAGIPERSPDGVVVRPLLGTPRAAVLRFAAERRVAWREDASNRQPRYARSRLRHDWLPELARAFNPRLVQSLASLAEAQQRDREWIEAAVAREAEQRFECEGQWLRIDAKDWDALPPALARRLARSALARAGAARDVSRVHLERSVRFLAGARPYTHIELPGGLRLVRDRRGFRLGPLPAGPRSQGPC